MVIKNIKTSHEQKLGSCNSTVTKSIEAANKANANPANSPHNVGFGIKQQFTIDRFLGESL